MRILIDADACPVVNNTEKIAKKYNIELILFFDITHSLNSDYAKLVRVDKRSQSVDMAIYNTCQKNDIIVTQDYGLAALVLGKKAKAINQNGKVYTENNIDHLLMRRHIHAKIRKAGGRHQNHKKRQKSDDQKFERALEDLINFPGR